MSDLNLAKTMLYEENLTLAIVKNGTVLFKTNSHRISGFLVAIEKLGTRLEHASLADRIAGKAIALLCVYVGVNNVYAEVLSRKAKALFEEYGILCEWKEIVDNIMNFNRNSVCPFEKVATDISNPEKAFAEFKTILRTFKGCK